MMGVLELNDKVTSKSRKDVPSVNACLDALDFVLPPDLEAAEPPEARGLARDDVRLMVSNASDDHVLDAQFRDLPSLLSSGDLVVINTSGTMNAALPAIREDGTALELHLSTQLPAGLWTVEVRRPDGEATRSFSEARAGERLTLPADASAVLVGPYTGNRSTPIEPTTSVRLWVASIQLPCQLCCYLSEHGYPIRYSYVRRSWPSSYYQTVYATEMGSAEMPSAGRPFTPEIVTRLVASGIGVAPILLHTGVASLEEHEPPYEELYRVPPWTARAANATRAGGGRVVAVGTTVVRALETVAHPTGRVYPGEGWTDLVISPQRGIRAVDALLTGFHEPKATHLAMLEALVGRKHLEIAYRHALEQGYLWHEFGDLHLMLR